MSEVAIRHPKRGKAHRPTKWLNTSVGMPWEGRRVLRTACGFGDGGTIRRMSEEIDIARVDEFDRCKTCWPTPERPEVESGGRCGVSGHVTRHQHLDPTDDARTPLASDLPCDERDVR